MPLDIQGAQVNPKELQGFNADSSGFQHAPLVTPSKNNFTDILELISSSKRPLFLAGYGVRCSKSVDLLRDLAEVLHIPVVTTQLAKDVLNYDHHLMIGHPGPKGDRPGNFAIQSSDLIICIGSSLHSQTTGWESSLFAPNAVIVHVDPDQAVLERSQVDVDYKINCDCNFFLHSLLINAKAISSDSRNAWIDCCLSWKERFAVKKEPHKRNASGINFYDFTECLSTLLISDKVTSDLCVVTDAGSALVLGQALRLKPGQRFISSGSMGAMGFALPAATVQQPLVD